MFRYRCRKSKRLRLSGKRTEPREKSYFLDRSHFSSFSRSAVDLARIVGVGRALVQNNFRQDNSRMRTADIEQLLPAGRFIYSLKYGLGTVEREDENNLENVTV